MGEDNPYKTIEKQHVSLASVYLAQVNCPDKSLKATKAKSSNVRGHSAAHCRIP